MLKYQRYSILLAGLIMLTAIAMLFIIKHNEWRDYPSEDMMGRWHYADGSPAELSGNMILDDNNSVSIFCDMGEPYNDSRSLCFRSHNIFFTIYADDKEIYSFNPELGGIYGTCYGDCIHTVPVPVGALQLKNSVTSLKDDRWDGFNEFVLQDPAEYTRSLTVSQLPAFIACAATFFIGVILFVLGIIMYHWHKEMIETICLGVITILLSVWCHSQVRVLHLIVSNPLMIRIIDYLAMELIPIPIWLYVASFTNSLRNPVVHAGVILSSLHVFISVLFTVIGIADYADFLVVTHLLICFGVIAIIWLIADATHKKRVNFEKSIYLIASFLAIAICALLDITRFYAFHASTISAMSRIGLSLFVIILTLYEFKQLIEMRITSSQAELMEKLAMEDTLTGIGSRAAFNEYENVLRKKDKGKCVFVHFDVNHLKKVNDNYGHAEGDKFIIAAADILKKSFGEKGHCFRVGGDEFFVILDRENCMSDYDEGLKVFLDEQEKYNLAELSPVPLHIAYGMAEYDLADGEPENAERLADSRMYIKKKQMKEELASV